MNVKPEETVPYSDLPNVCRTTAARTVPGQKSQWTVVYKERKKNRPMHTNKIMERLEQ